MITDIRSLGTEYSITDHSGEVIKTLQVVPHDEIIEATIGEYDESAGSFDEYLEKSVALLTGYEAVDHTKVLWVSTTEDSVAAKEIVERAIVGDYDFVILEQISNNADI